MRGKRWIALVMAGIMLTGQPVLAQEPNVVGTDLALTDTNKEEVVEIVTDINLTSYLSDSFEMSLDIYEKGIEVVSQNEQICTAVCYHSGELAGTLTVAFERHLPGETMIFVKDNEGNIYRQYHVTIERNPQTAYVGYPIMFFGDNNMAGEIDEAAMSVEVMDPSVCDVELVLEKDSEYGLTVANILVTGKKPGETLIRVMYDGFIQMCSRYISVEEPPEDLVKINDPYLLHQLTTYGAWPEPDADKDGYVTENEMEAVTSISISDGRITDLTGLEYAVNLTSINLTGNKELKNVDALFQLKNLNNIVLRDTGVSGSDIFRLMEIEGNFDVGKGTFIYPSNRKVYVDDISAEVVEGSDVVKIFNDPTYVIPGIQALEAGNAVVRYSLRGDFFDVKIHVEGIEADQPLNENSDHDVVSVEKTKMLDSIGRLWEIGSEAQLIQENVEKYVCGTIKDFEEEETFEHVLDMDGNLWCNGKIIAKNVKETQGHYALNEDDQLIDVACGTNIVQMNDVLKWTVETVSMGYTPETGMQLSEMTYVLKKDGTLWRCGEVQKGTPHTFEKIADDVKDLGDNGKYLKLDGDLVTDNVATGIQRVDQTDLAELPSNLYYKNLNGDAYVMSSSTGKYVNVGNLNVVDAMVGGKQNPEDLSWQYATYFLTDDGVLRCITTEGKIEDVANDVMKFANGEEAGYLSGDGIYRDLSGQVGTIDDPFIIESFHGGQYHLEDYGVSADYILSTNGVILLTHVKSVYDNAIDGLLITRTDGTVWKMIYGGIPQMILDLNMETDSSEMTEGQRQEIVDEILSSESEGTVSVEMGSATIIPQEVLNAAHDKNVILKCTLADGTVWEIDGSSLREETLKNTNLSVTRTTKEGGSISTDAISELAGTRPAEQLNFTDGGFDLAASISLAVDSTFKNMKCVAVDLEEDTEKLLGVAMVKDEQMTLALAQTKDCALVYGLNGDTSADDRVNITDLMQTLHHVSGRTVFGVVEQGISDVNLNGRTDITDLMQMLHYTSGRNETL